MQAHTKSVLIVDDDPDIRANIKDILDDYGFRTDTASDGFAALKLLQNNPYDLALLDFKMPGMDGVELSREMQKLDQEIVVILITAYAGSHDDANGLKNLSWKVLQKPVNMNILLPLVQAACVADRK